MRTQAWYDKGDGEEADEAERRDGMRPPQREERDDAGECERREDKRRAECDEGNACDEGDDQQVHRAAYAGSCAAVADWSRTCCVASYPVSAS